MLVERLVAALRGRHRQGNCSWGADPLADQTAGRKATTVTKLCRHHLADVEVGRLQLPVNVDIMDRVEHCSHMIWIKDTTT